MSHRASCPSFSAVFALAAASAIGAGCTSAGSSSTRFTPVQTDDAAAAADAATPVEDSAFADHAAASETGATPDAGCTLDSDCGDGNPCTDDTCAPTGACLHAPNSAACDDGNPCTVGDTCSAAVCVGGGNGCSCQTTSDCAAHEDGNLCNGTLVCSAAGQCVIDAATVIDCPSGQDPACAKNTCEPSTGICSMAVLPDGAACQDGDACTTGDTCRGGQCRGSESCCGDATDNDGDQAADCDDPDCAGTPACSTQCPTLEPADEAPLEVQALSNATSTTTANGYTDDYVYNQAGDRKLGTRRDWGGSIVFFGIDNGSAGTNGTNTIDGADTGREVQIALYDPERWYQGCAWNASCLTVQTPCEQTMSFFGWNPVQGGNRCNNGSGVTSVTQQGGGITTTTQPLFWNPNWDRTDCQLSCSNPSTDERPSDVELTQRVRFVRSDVVELSYKVTNLSDLDHKSTAHEFPTVYASFGKNGTPDLYRLFGSSGNEITAGWSTDAHGFRYQNFTSPGGWASLQNQNADYGVALYYEAGMSSFQAWNKADNPKFNNFRGLYVFPIGPHAQVRARSYLILGSIGSVAAQAQWLDNNLPPFGWLDSPAANASVSGTVSVHGWALDNKSVAAVEMIVDGGAPIQLNYGTSRPDVCMVWPGYPACSHGNVGFQGSLNTSALGANPCGHAIEIRATDNQGNARVIARQRFYLAP